MLTHHRYNVMIRSMDTGFGRHGMLHPPLMTQVCHFVSRIKKRQRCDVQTMWAYDLDLWPSRSPRLSVIRVLVLGQSTKCKFCWYYDYSFSDYGPLGQHSSDWSRDLATLTCDLGGHGSSSSIRTSSLKFVRLAIQKIWCINGPGDPDLWPFDLETGMLVASKVGNFPSKFGHARPLASRIIRYVRDGQTDGRKQPWLLTLEVMAPEADADHRPPSVHQLWSS